MRPLARQRRLALHTLGASARIVDSAIGQVGRAETGQQEIQRVTTCPLVDPGDGGRLGDIAIRKPENR